MSFAYLHLLYVLIVFSQKVSAITKISQIIQNLLRSPDPIDIISIISTKVNTYIENILIIAVLFYHVVYHTAQIMTNSYATPGIIPV